MVDGRERRKEGREKGKMGGYINGCMDGGEGGEDERKGEFSAGSLNSRSDKSKLRLGVGRDWSVDPE